MMIICQIHRSSAKLLTHKNIKTKRAWHAIKSVYVRKLTGFSDNVVYLYPYCNRLFNWPYKRKRPITPLLKTSKPQNLCKKSYSCQISHLVS